jgi:hypothetical protein
MKVVDEIIRLRFIAGTAVAVALATMAFKPATLDARYGSSSGASALAAPTMFSKYPGMLKITRCSPKQVREFSLTGADTQPSPETYYKFYWKLGVDNFLYIGSVPEWRDWEHRFDGQTEDYEQAEHNVRSWVNKLEDQWAQFLSNAELDYFDDDIEQKDVVASRIFENNGKKLVYIQIKTFLSRKLNEEFLAAAKEASKANVQGIVLDLRDNGGGFVDEATKLTAQFLDDKQVIYYEEGRVDGVRYRELAQISKPKGSKTEVIVKTTRIAGNGDESTLEPEVLSVKTCDIGQLPIVILINKRTASASENLAVAIRENRLNSRIVGIPSYGKGEVQRGWMVSYETGKGPIRGAMFCTIAKWFTPQHRSVQSLGVLPDIQQDSEPGYSDKQLEKAIETLHSLVSSTHK